MRTNLNFQENSDTINMMTSNRPYFIRALYEWILDNDCTPYIVVDATLPYVDVPQQFVHDGKIILNILPSAIHNLDLGDDWITFSARFSGVPQNINIPIGAVIAIYAQENGEGMGFQAEALTESHFDSMQNPQLRATHKKEKAKQNGPKLGIISSKQEESHLDKDTEDHSPSPDDKGPKGGLKIIK